MLNTSEISFAYNREKSFTFPALNATVDEASLILGPSGCGKSTLLHLLGGLMPPQSGSIEINGSDISQMNGSTLDEFRGSNIGIIFQKPHFIRSLNVLDNLLVAPFFGKGKVDKTEARNILDGLGLGDKTEQNYQTLSQGEQQRLSIARVLINQPKLILADEPTSALDDENCNAVIQLLMKKAKECNAALVIVTHDGRLKDEIKNQILLTKALYNESA